ncbi:LOW QUALITY PROTEIN: uncharacterized protein LOC131950305 [Physella acuta]|uniref:LOW QUALITY PROTEIN: uncharacterized protein LOC131950305 n=1 Tax=Physella acuta TaxID=109671 RepID=UPI0027DDE6DA|nr:LOW QUALITY PROTEIN: uncharacterized protein LOC131950305 [Physella acuta]
MGLEYINGSQLCSTLYNISTSSRKEYGIKPQIEMYEALLIIGVTGVLAFMLAWLFSLSRKYIYKDEVIICLKLEVKGEDQLDTAFDAGGNVNAGLTATTIVSQWTWAATLLQSSTVTAKYGISGSFWYAAGATVQILLFSMLAVQFKTRAPGAKTFLQVIRARFGRHTHIVVCCFALATNVIVTSMLMLGGSAVITSLVKSIDVEFATTLIAAVVGSYTFLGGLGATFYVSYFNLAIIYVIMIILIFKVYEDGSDLDNPLGNITITFQYLSCVKGPEGNKNFNYLTILSNEGLMFGLINVVGNFGTVIVDQSYWQCAVAAKPKQGVVGFILGGMAWFAIPFSLSTAMGLAYIALSAEQGGALLTDAEVNAGLVPPAVAYRLLGKPGAIFIVVIVLMAVTSTGASEIMAVTSIVVYDIYAVYLKPYRHTTDTNSCILCGKGRGRMANPRDKCICVSMTYCAKCHQDNKNRSESRRAIKPDYKCNVHGAFRTYNDYLSRLSNWTLVWTTIAIIPVTVVLYMIQASLGWVYLVMGILVGSAVIPITLSMFWQRLTSIGMTSGCVGGAVIAISVWLGVASKYEGGLKNWWKSTGDEVAMLSGNVAAIVSGGVITVVVSYFTNRYYDVSMGYEIWENTRDIDNPLTPWMEKHQKELNLSQNRQLDNRPSLEEVQQVHRQSYVMAYSLSTVFSVVILILWPALMVIVGVMTLEQFTSWVRLSEVWACLAMVVMIVLPLVNEVWDVWSALTQRNKVGDQEMFIDAENERTKLSTPSVPDFKTARGVKKRGISFEANHHGNEDALYTITDNENGPTSHSVRLSSTENVNGLRNSGHDVITSHDVSVYHDVTFARENTATTSSSRAGVNEFVVQHPNANDSLNNVQHVSLINDINSTPSLHSIADSGGQQFKADVYKATSPPVTQPLASGTGLFSGVHVRTSPLRHNQTFSDLTPASDLREHSEDHRHASSPETTDADDLLF